MHMCASLLVVFNSTLTCFVFLYRPVLQVCKDGVERAWFRAHSERFQPVHRQQIAAVAKREFVYQRDNVSWVAKSLQQRQTEFIELCLNIEKSLFNRDQESPTETNGVHSRALPKYREKFVRDNKTPGPNC